MEKRKKTTLIVGFAAFVLALAVFLFVYHLPEDLSFSAPLLPDNAKAEQVEAQVTVDFKKWKRIFFTDKIMGTVTINGEKYVYHKPANDPGHPEVAVLIPEAKKASPTEWLEDFVTVQIKEHDILQISRRRGNEALEYSMAFAVTKEG